MWKRKKYRPKPDNVKKLLLYSKTEDREKTKKKRNG